MGHVSKFNRFQTTVNNGKAGLENEVSDTSNAGFSRKRLNRDVLVFGVSEGGGDFAFKNKKTPPLSNLTLTIIIPPFNTGFQAFNVALWARGGAIWVSLWPNPRRQLNQAK